MQDQAQTDGVWLELGYVGPWDDAVAGMVPFYEMYAIAVPPLCGMLEPEPVVVHHEVSYGPARVYADPTLGTFAACVRTVPEVPAGLTQITRDDYLALIAPPPEEE